MMAFVPSFCRYKYFAFILLGEVISALASELQQEPKIVMARIVFSFPMLIALSVIYIIIGALFVFRCPPQHKSQVAGGLLDS